MDELALLKDMADRTPLPSADELAPARGRLAAVITQQNGAAGGESGRINGAARLVAASGRPGRRRLLVSGLAAGGLAAAITLVVSLGGLEPVGVAPAKASAAAVLEDAAAAQRALPSTPPRPDQFIYTKTQNGDGSVGEAWLSADGTRDGLVVGGGRRDVIPGCRDGQAQVYKGGEPMPGVLEPCTPLPAYRTDLPTDKAGMREYLDQNPTRAGKEIYHLVEGTYVPPAAMAAIFEVMADFPGLTVTENAKDGAGRPGIGVSWDTPSADGHSTNTVVFDKETHAFLGLSTYHAVVEQAIVDEAGQLPQ